MPTNAALICMLWLMAATHTVVAAEPDESFAPSRAVDCRSNRPPLPILDWLLGLPIDTPSVRLAPLNSSHDVIKVLKLQRTPNAAPPTSPRLIIATTTSDAALIDVALVDSRGFHCHSSDLPSRQQVLVVPEGFQGDFIIRRRDLLPIPIDVIINTTLETETVSKTGPAATTSWFSRTLSRGHSLRIALPWSTYDRIARIGSCEFKSTQERQRDGCAAQLSSTLHRTTPLAWLNRLSLFGSNKPSEPALATSGSMAAETSSDWLADDSVLELYSWLSRLMGRIPANEFRKSGIDDPEKSEPIILFVGISGISRVILLDCSRRTNTMCSGMATPSDRNIERADYVWVAYVEDEQTDFETSIDVQFSGRVADVDYETFDPRDHIRVPSTVGALPAEGRTVHVRLGFRRFRVRGAPSTVQTIFTRQSASYGTRQWQGVFRRYSQFHARVSGEIAFPATAVSSREYAVLPTVPADGSTPTSARISADDANSQIFAGVAFGITKWRAQAPDRPTFAGRLIVRAIPDVIGAMGVAPAVARTWFVGARWPVLWDRLSFVAGRAFVRQDQLHPGRYDGQAVPLDTNVDDILLPGRWQGKWLAGLSIELIRSP